MVAVGGRAPAFSGILTDGATMRPFELAEVLGQGPVVLAFFPFAFSSTCQEQLCELRDSQAGFEQADAKIFGISTDSPFALKAYHQANGFAFPLISDFNKEAVRAFGVMQSAVRGLKDHAQRACFIIDDDGTVAWRWATEDPDQKPELQEIQAALAVL